MLRPMVRRSGARALPPRVGGRALRAAAAAVTAVLVAVVVAVPRASAAGCTNTWDGGAGADTSWANPVNWQGDTLPGSTDRACIPNGFNAVHSSGSDTISSLQVD